MTKTATTKAKVAKDLAPELPKGTAPPAVESGYIPIEQIREVGDNHRRELGDVSGLAQSMGIAGQLQPVVLTRNGSGFILAAGHRRLAAARLLGWSEIFATIRPMEASERKAYMAIENLQREDLSPLEEAEAIQELLDLGLSVTDTAGISKRRIEGRVALLRLPASARKALAESAITLGEAQALLELADHPKAIDRIVRRTDGRDILWQVRHAKAEIEADEAHARAVAGVKAKGWTVVQPGEYGRTPKGIAQLGRDYYAPWVDMTPAAHGKLACHRAWVVHGYVMCGCADPTSHGDKYHKKSADGGGSGTSRTVLKERQARNKAVRAAAAVHREALRDLVLEIPAEAALEHELALQVAAYGDYRRLELARFLGLVADDPGVYDKTVEKTAVVLFNAWAKEAGAAKVLLAERVRQLLQVMGNLNTLREMSERPGGWVDRSKEEEKRGLGWLYEQLRARRYTPIDGDHYIRKAFGILPAGADAPGTATVKRKPAPRRSKGRRSA